MRYTLPGGYGCALTSNHDCFGLIWEDSMCRRALAKGNLIQGKLSSSSSLVQVEGMTFRLWMAEIHTVTFGKDAPRYIVSMAGNPEVAEGFVSRLKHFADGVASVVALNNSANAERLASNNLLANRLGNIGAISTTEAIIATLGESTVPPSPRTRCCIACRASVQPNECFCGSCGEPVT
jgi:hypothetical protein